MRTLFVALLAIALMPSLAVAGGNKGNTIRIHNSGGDILAVIVDHNVGLNSGHLDASAFFRAGGRFVPPGATIPIPVKFTNNNAGVHTIYAAYIIDIGSNFALGAEDSVTIFVPRNRTTKVTATEDIDGDVTLIPSI